jgi:DNA-binding NtrC family response regulator
MDTKAKILVVDDERDIREGLTRILEEKGYLVNNAKSGEEALEIMERDIYDLVLLDLKMPGLGGEKTLEAIKRENEDTIVIMITAYATIESAVSCIKMGAFDYISKPFTKDEVLLFIEKALKERNLSLENEYLKKMLAKEEEEGLVVGENREMKRIYEIVRKVALQDSNVLLTGESGTGKELVAKLIHRNSERREKQFVHVDCGTLTETLLASELFGHLKGAFTGALTNKKGLLELANGGTFFFDEIGDVSLEFQSKLLRVIQDKLIRPVGSEKSIHVDVRIICATNKDLERKIREGSFREDLYYRINVIHIHLPPLRKRKEDIPLLANYFLEKYSRLKEKKVKSISPKAMELLLSYDWPGNIRELENVIERAIVLEEGKLITPGDLPSHIQKKRRSPVKIKTLYEVEKEHIIKALEENEGNKTKTAISLGIPRRTLYEKIKKYNIYL